MFDWLRNLGKSAEEKQQEALTAYLDNALTPAQRQAFERELAQDAGLQDAMEQQRRLKMQLRQLPRLAAPRHFTLDPAVYGQQRPATTMGSYTILRTATVLAAFFFVLALVVDFSSTGDQRPMVAMDEAAPAAEQSTGGVVAESVESEDTDQETAEEEEAADEPTEEMSLDIQEEIAEEVAPETAGDAAGEEIEVANGAATGYPAPMTSTFQAEPTLTVGAGQTEEPAALAPAATPTLASTPTLATAGGGPRPTPVPPLVGREATIQSPLQYTNTVDTAAPTLAPTREREFLNEPGEPISAFRLVEFALGGIFLVLLALTLLVRRRI